MLAVLTVASVGAPGDRGAKWSVQGGFSSNLSGPNFEQVGASTPPRPLPNSTQEMGDPRGHAARRRGG